MPASDVLEHVGLSPNESKIYQTLLRIGAASVTDVTKKSGVHRSNAYDTIERLMDKGLVTLAVESEKKLFKAAHPERLLDMLKEKEKTLIDAMPQLTGQYEFSKGDQQVFAHKGKGGVQTALKDLNNYKEYDAFGISENLGKIVPFYFPHWIRERLEKKLFARMITSEGDTLNTPAVLGYRNYLKLFEVKELPKEFKTPAATFIYAEKILIILETEIPLCIMIENREINAAYKKHFDMLWKIAKPEDKSKYNRWKDT